MSQCQLWLLNNKVDKSGNNKKSLKYYSIVFMLYQLKKELKGDLS